MVTIKNLTRRPVSLRLNSGMMLHLPPGTTLSQIDDVEVQSNDEVQKLQDRCVLELSGGAVTTEEPVAEAAPSAAKPRRK
jgi:hypothetical protein